ncbi:OmpA/MotB family protein [Thermodesulfovibrio hydrogeniphilus]
MLDWNDKNNNHDDEQENHERWLISYSDFLTLLFTFFVALYALSVVDTKKAESFSESLRRVFKVIESPIMVEDEWSKTIIERLNKQLSGIKGIGIKSDARGLVITLQDYLLFDSGKAEIKPESIEALTKIAEELKTFKNRISIEGHTDNVPITSSQFKSNWELSTARAVSVLHFFLEQGLSPDRFTVTGYAEYKPVDTNETEEGRAKNRRVEIILWR